MGRLVCLNYSRNSLFTLGGYKQISSVAGRAPTLSQTAFAASDARLAGNFVLKPDPLLNSQMEAISGMGIDCHAWKKFKAISIAHAGGGLANQTGPKSFSDDYIGHAHPRRACLPLRHCRPGVSWH